MNFEANTQQIVYESLSDTVDLGTIYKIVNMRGGCLTYQDEDLDINGNIPVTAKIYLTCARKHNCAAIVANINEWCTICKLLDIMNKYDTGITCMQCDYVFGQFKFEFICSYGHRFVASRHDCKKGCRSCFILQKIKSEKNVVDAITMDTYCVNYNNNARLRFHCNILRHDPKCTNTNCADIYKGYVMSKYKYAPGCKNFISCNQDFYATPTKLHSSAQVYSCDDNHTWEREWEIISTVRIFEIYFNLRFDDADFHTDDIVMTGYNKNLAIAFTHGSDKLAEKCKDPARSWCEKYGIIFIYIEKNITTAAKITTCIVTQLIKNNICKDLIDPTIQRIRTRMRKMNADNKLFEDRCV